MTGSVHRFSVGLLLLTAMATTGVAQDTPARSAPTTQPASGWPTTQPDSESIEQQLLGDLEVNPAVAPTVNRRPNDSFSPPTIGSTGLDPGVLGIAPGQEQPKLRREGEFIVNRRGRLVRATNGHHTLFVFEADSNTAPEPPMILTACQMLQNMESIVRERGDQTVFIVSGQILAYRGVNHLLPTMMRLAIDHGNLDN